MVGGLSEAALSQSTLIHQSATTVAANVIDDFVLDAMRKTSLQQLKKRSVLFPV